MKTKLTLRLESDLIGQAKKYARKEGKSISQIVADYFKAIQRRATRQCPGLGPITSQLRGCLKGRAVRKADYRKHLERKYL
ncbi:MAG: antitoxin [Chitinivibrionales bacterium]|nr:antitoxin [Chitinivibrionales bacterium]MBD3396188.1 antitoxin [Chitinivibrionales bacterium]